MSILNYNLPMGSGSLEGVSQSFGIGSAPNPKKSSKSRSHELRDSVDPHCGLESLHTQIFGSIPVLQLILFAGLDFVASYEAMLQQ